MITEYNSIDLFGKPLFSWFTMKTPMEKAVPLPSAACFAYIMDGDNHYLSEEENIKAAPGQVILSLCGTRVGHVLSRQREGEGMISAIVVHFQKDVLLKIYENTKPPHWIELEKPLVKQIVQEAASELVKQYFQGLVHLFNNVECSIRRHFDFEAKRDHFIPPANQRIGADLTDHEKLVL